MTNVALIGVGYWGSKLKRYIEENQAFNLRYVCDSKSDLDEVWSDEQITAVVEATSNDARYGIIKSALLHGKNVLAEKPLALRSEECEELKQIASDRNLLLLIDYTWTFSKGLQKAKEMVSAGRIGKVLAFELSHRHLGRFGVGVYWALGSHMLSILDMFVPIENYRFEKADIVTHGGEVETGVISFELGQIVVSLNYPGKETRVMIYGEEGTIIFEPTSRPSLQLERYERLVWTDGSRLPREHEEFDIDETDNLRYVMEHFALQEIAGSNADRAITITRILEGLTDGFDRIHDN